MFTVFVTIIWQFLRMGKQISFPWEDLSFTLLLREAGYSEVVHALLCPFFLWQCHLPLDTVSVSWVSWLKWFVEEGHQHKQPAPWKGLCGGARRPITPIVRSLGQLEAGTETDWRAVLRSAGTGPLTPPSLNQHAVHIPRNFFQGHATPCGEIRKIPLKAWGFPGGSDGKKICLKCGKPRLDPWLGKIPRSTEWQSTLVFLPREFPWTEKPGGLQSMGSQRVGYNWATNI